MPKDFGKEFEPVEVDKVPLEQMRAVVAALAERLDVRLEKREQFYGETEFRFVGKR